MFEIYRTAIVRCPSMAGAGVLATILGLTCAPHASQAAVGRIAGQADVSATGAAQYSISLRLPQGRSSELTPSLALRYSSSGGNGIVGMGFTIAGFSSITRCVKSVAQDGVAGSGPIKKLQSDGYCLEGNRLRRVSGVYGAAGSEYRTEIDSIAKITAQGSGGNAGPASFVVRHKSGLDYEYGTTASSSIPFVGSSIVREWALAKIRDRAGNTIDFSYVGTADSGSYRADEIRYTGGPFTAPYTIKFVYQDGRSDTIFRYVAGDPVHETMLLSRVEVRHNGSLMRQYLLTYLPPDGIRRSRLNHVRECAQSVEDCLAPTVFAWTNGSASLSSEQSVGQAIANTGATWHLIDIDGDARDDLVYVSSTGAGGTWRLRKAQLGGGFGAEINTGLANTNYAQAMSLEWDGDGWMDLLVPYSGGRWYVLRSTGNSFAPPFDTGIAAVGAGDYLRPFDINGDGRDDLVRISSSGPATVWVRYREAANFSTAETVRWTSTYPSVQFQRGFGTYEFKYRSRIRRADFDGDGREDFIAPLGQYDPESGQTVWDYHAFFAGLPGSPIDPESPDKGGNHLLADLNGDGNTDLVWTQAGNYFRFAHSSGGELQLPQNGPGTSGYNPLAYFATDYDGDGRDDLLIPRFSPATLHFVRSTGNLLAQPVATNVTGVSNAGVALFTGELDGNGYADLAIQKPDGTLAYRLQSTTPRDLLESVTDGFNVISSFIYTPVSDPSVHTRLTGAKYPLREYQFGSQIVKAFTASNGIGGSYTVSYQYKGARRDAEGRGYLGFAERSFVDSRTGLRTVESYRQDFPYVGGLASRTTYQSATSSTKVAELINTWQKQTSGAANEEHHFPFVSGTVLKQYEVGGSANGALITTTMTASTRDQWGSVVVHEVAVTAANESSTFVTRTFVPDPASDMLNDEPNWCLGRPERTHITSRLPSGISATRRAKATYNAALCRVTQEVIEPDEADPKLRLTKDFGYDACGNRNGVALTGDDGHGAVVSRAATTIFDSVCRFPESSLNAEGHQQHMFWEPAQGVMTDHFDENGQQTTWRHDSFGRLQSELRADGSSTVWTYARCTNSCGVSHAAGVYQVTVTESTGAQSSAIYDAFGREVRQSRVILGGGTSHVDTIYDQRGNVDQRSAPYVSGTPVLWTAFGYDNLGRLTSEQPAGRNSASIAHEGLITRITDPKGHTTTRITDAIGQVVQVLDAMNAGTSYRYGPFGNLTDTLDPAGNQIHVDYDIRGRKFASIDPDMGQWTYVHNSFDELVSQKHGNDPPTLLRYDRIGRLKQRDEPEGTTTFSWDTAPNGIGRLNVVSSPQDYAEIYSYDTLGRQVEVTTAIGPELFPITTSYDGQGRIATIEYPESEVVLGVPRRPPSISVPANSTNGSYTIGWSAADGAVDAYELYEDTTAGFTSPIQVYGGSSTSHAISGKSNGVYYYRVRACNSYGCSAYATGSGPTSVTLPPGTPSSITVPASSTNGSYTVSWSTASGAVTGYQLYEATNSGFSGEVSVYNGISTSVSLSGKGNGVYYYRVRACNGNVCSAFATAGNPVSVTLPPGTPGSVSVPSTSTNGSYSISWGSASGKVTAYQLYEATNSGFSGEVLVYSGTSASVARSGKGNGVYYYRVRACNGSACSFFVHGGNPVNVTLPPGTPSISVPANSTNGSYTVTWSVPSGNVTSYHLYEAPSSTFAGEVQVYSGPGTSAAISGKGNGTYYYRVFACNGSACGSFSAGGAVSVTWPPSMPPSITFTNPISGTFAVTWGASSGTLTAYQLYEASSPDFAWEWMAYSGTSTGTVIVERPPGGYWYRVRACNGGACSGYRTGGPVNVMPPDSGDPDPPFAPPKPESTAANKAQAGLEEAAADETAVLGRSDLPVMPTPERATHEVTQAATAGWSAGAAEEFADAVRAIWADERSNGEYDSGLHPALLRWWVNSRTGEKQFNALDDLRRVQSEPEPYRFRVRYEYGAHGHLQQLVNDRDPSEVFWQATAMNAAGQVTGVNYGNGLSTSRTYDAVTGAIKQITTGSGGSVQSLTYEWNDAGYLKNRQDTGRGLMEEYEYDALHRLKEVSGPSAMSLTYSAIGNVETKSGVGTYEYTPGKPPHQVASVRASIGGPVLQSFGYDDRGNMTSRNGSNISWTSYNLPSQINEGGNYSQFSYGANRNRFRQVTVEGGQQTTTLYAGGGLYERLTQGSRTSHRHYIVGADGVFAVHERRSDLTGQMRYLHSDHLGGVEAISDEQATVLARLSFDAFGQRRGSLWTGNPSLPDRATIGGTTRRGYTFHEHLVTLDLVHMNGRVYDPALGRFLSADPFVPEPFNLQSLNRYSYVLNSPLSYTDPSGYRYITVDEWGTSGAWFNDHSIDLGAWMWVTGSIGPDVFSADLNYPAPMPEVIFVQSWLFASPVDPQTVDIGVGVGAAESTVGGTGLWNAWSRTSYAFANAVADFSMASVQWSIDMANSLGNVAQGRGAERDSLNIGVGYLLAGLSAIPGGFGDDAAKGTTYLYRGFHAGHPAIEAARAGRAVPGNIRGAVTAAEHNLGAVSANSQFTSWTTELSVARLYAGENGVILRVPAGAPPSGATWSWQWSPDVFHENEVLLRGVREGCTVMLCVR